MEREKTPSELYINVAKSILNLKFVMGMLLIAIGVYAVITIIIIIYRIFMDLAEVPFMSQILGAGDKLIEIISTNAGGISVSDKIVGYVAAFIFLSIGSSLSVKIITIGFKIVDKMEFKYMMEKIWQEWQKTKKTSEVEEHKLPGSSQYGKIK